VTFRICYDEFIAQGASSRCSLRAQIEKRILGRCEKFFAYRALQPMARILRLALGGSQYAAFFCLHGVLGADLIKCRLAIMIAQSQRSCTGPCRLRRVAATSSRTDSNGFARDQRMRTAVAGLTRSPALGVIFAEWRIMPMLTTPWRIAMIVVRLNC
jgi:hypothetical protein